MLQTQLFDGLTINQTSLWEVASLRWGFNKDGLASFPLATEGTTCEVSKNISTSRHFKTVLRLWGFVLAVYSVPSFILIALAKWEENKMLSCEMKLMNTVLTLRLFACFCRSEKWCPLRGNARLFLHKAFGCLSVWLGTEICLKFYAETVWQCWGLPNSLSCAPEMVYRDLIFAVWMWNTLVEKLLTWTYVDPGLMGCFSSKAIVSGELHILCIAKQSSCCSSLMWVLEHCVCSWGFVPSSNAIGSCLNHFCCARQHEEFAVGQRPLGWNFNIVPVL